MKIIQDSKKGTAYIGFIEEGECFYDKNGDLMMKIEYIKSSRNKGFNCVDCSTGRPGFVDENTRYELVDAEIHVN